LNPNHQELVARLLLPDDDGLTVSVMVYTTDEGSGASDGDNEHERGSEHESAVSSVLMEQQICSLATVCLLNHWSTFSHTIRFWREAQRTMQRRQEAGGGSGKKHPPLGDIWWGS
jgi:hypothetical protein